MHGGSKWLPATVERCNDDGTFNVRYTSVDSAVRARGRARARARPAPPPPQRPALTRRMRAQVLAIALTPSADALAVAGDDGHVRVFAIVDGVLRPAPFVDAKVHGKDGASEKVTSIAGAAPYGRARHRLEGWHDAHPAHRAQVPRHARRERQGEGEGAVRAQRRERAARAAARAQERAAGPIHVSRGGVGRRRR